MKNNKLLGIILWAIGLMLVHLIVFCISLKHTSAVWITYGFTLFAFLSQLALWLYIWHKPQDASETFLHTPMFMLSICYVIAQIVLCFIFTIWSAASIRIVVFANGLFLMIAMVLSVLSMIAKNHIERVDNRQNNRRIEL